MEKSIEKIPRQPSKKQRHMFSSLFLHNIDPDERLSFLEKIYERVSPGGYFGTYDKLFLGEGDVARNESAKLMTLYVPRLHVKGLSDLATKLISHELHDIQNERVYTVAQCIEDMQEVEFEQVHEYKPANTTLESPIAID